MTWASRLLRFAIGGHSELPPGVPALPALLADGSALLDRCAALAPAQGVSELQRLAAQESARATELRAKLAEAGVSPAVLPGQVVTPEGQNHWARLVQVLEQHRELRERLLESAIAATDSHPQLALLLEQLSRETHGITERLRDLVARADPQALD